MRLTPRKNEVEVIVSLLKSDDFDSEESMAKAIIKEVAQVLSERDTFGLAVGMDPEHPLLALGPWYSAGDAEKGAQEAREAGLTARVARLGGTGSIKPAEVRTSACGTCGHRAELHPKANKCVVLPTCSCKGFTKVEQ